MSWETGKHAVRGGVGAATRPARNRPGRVRVARVSSTPPSWGFLARLQPGEQAVRDVEALQGIAVPAQLPVYLGAVAFDLGEQQAVAALRGDVGGALERGQRARRDDLGAEEAVELCLVI